MPEKKEDAQTKWQKLIAGVKDKLSDMQGDLDDAGVERKELTKMITPEAVDSIREAICEVDPALCEGDEPVVADIMQAVIDGLSEEMPESDVEEEMALVEGDDKAEGEDEEDKEEELKLLTSQVTDLANSHDGLISDMSEVVQLVHKTIEVNTKQLKENDDLRTELKAIQKQLNSRPRRASHAPETEVDPDSDLAKNIKANNHEDVPDYYKDIYEVG